MHLTPCELFRFVSSLNQQYFLNMYKNIAAFIAFSGTVSHKQIFKFEKSFSTVLGLHCCVESLDANLMCFFLLLFFSFSFKLAQYQSRVTD